MRQFIKDNTPYSQTDREDLVNHYISIGCEEVSILYDGIFLKPFWNGTNAIGTLTTSTYPNLTELSYVKGVTSAIQTQLDGKLSSAAGAVGETNLANGSVTGAKLGSMTSANLSVALTDETAEIRQSIRQ